MRRSAPLAAVLLIQACLLFAGIGLLPVWGDELFTVRTVSHPATEIVSIVQKDIHPPLYFLLQHQWTRLPLPWTGIDALRAFSAIWAMAATLLFDWFFARRLRGFERWLAVGLFALSPCLLLYGRMARSYSMQVALVLLALAMIERWVLKPRSMALASASLAVVVALLYTHYAPGLAILAGFALLAWRWVGAWRATAFLAVSLAAYFPWLVTLGGVLYQWGTAAGFASNYMLTGNPAAETGLRIGFTLVSLTIGESFEVWSLLLVPVLLWFAFRGALRGWRVTALAIIAVIGYVGVARWVSYPFIAARLLWLAPFLWLSISAGIYRLRTPAIRCTIIAAVALSYATSDWLYFHRSGFLNPGYTAPLGEMAAEIDNHVPPGSLVLIDSFGMDAMAVTAYLSDISDKIHWIPLDPSRVDEARRRVSTASGVWVVRPVRDVSPGHVVTELQARACAGKTEHDDLYEPLPGWQQTAMSLMGVQPVPRYFYQVTWCGNPP